MAAKIIKKINLNGESYDIYAYSAISAYSADYAGVAKSIDGDISWSSISGLAVASGNASVTGFWTPTAISANIDQAIKDNINDLGIVYHFIDTITELPTNLGEDDAGAVYNVTEIINLGKTIDGDNISAFPGDNIVWNGKAWDKLAASVSLDGYATQQWVQDHILGEDDNYVDQHLAAATSAVVFGDITENKTTNAWKAVTDYVDEATDNLTSADYWNSVYNTVSSTSGSWTATTTAVNTSAEYWNYAYDTVHTSANKWNETTDAVTASAADWNYAHDAITGAIKTASELSAAAEANENEAIREKLVQAGAITDYVDGKIAETIAETIEIAHEITDSTPEEYIPDVGAIKKVRDDLMEHAETSGVNIHYYAEDESLHIFTQYDGAHPANDKDK